MDATTDELTPLQLVPPPAQQPAGDPAEEKTPSDKAMNIRMEPELHELCVAAGKRDGLAKSVWAREVLTAVLRSKLSLAEVVEAVNQQARRPAPQVFARGTVADSLGRTVITPANCIHPRHLIKTFETFERCLCGKNLPLPSPDGGEPAPK